MRPPHPAAANDKGPLGAADEARRPVDQVVVGRRTGVDREMLGRLRQVRGPEENVDRDVHEDRTGSTAQGEAHRLGRGGIRVVGRIQGRRLLGEAPHHLDVVHLLQRAHAPA